MSNLALTVDLQSSGGSLHFVTPIYYFPVNAPEGDKAATAHRGVKRVVACGSQSCVGCWGVFSLTHTFVAEAASCFGGLWVAKKFVRVAVIDSSS